MSEMTMGNSVAITCADLLLMGIALTLKNVGDRYRI